MSRVGLFGQISEINDHLYLSGAGVMRPEKLKQKGITCVVNATIEEPTAHMQGIDCVRIRIEDSPFARIDHYFDMVADKIRSIRDKGGRTLVHCVAGVSRSATLCIVYLIKYERMSLRQAYHYVKSARPIIRPNLGFWQQMVEYEQKLRGHNTVTMIPSDGLFPCPDVYSQDLRKHIIMHPGQKPQNDPQLIALQKRLRDREREVASAAARVATLIPVQLVNGNGTAVSRDVNGSNGTRRTLGSMSNGTDSSVPLRHRHSTSTLPGRSLSQQQEPHRQNGYHSTSTASSALPWRMSSLLSPALGRRSANGFSNGSAKSGANSGLFGVPSFQQSSLFPAF